MFNGFGGGTGRGLGIPVMGHSGGQDPDSNYFLYKQMLADQLLKQGIQPPAVPERSWTQGAARLAGSLLGAYKQNKLDQQMQDFQGSRATDMNAIAQALNGGAPLSSVMPNIHNPSMQNLVMQNIMNQNQQQFLINKGAQAQNAIAERQQQLDDYKNAHDPERMLKVNISKTNDAIAATQAALGQEQDPNKAQQLQNTLNNLQQTQLAFTNQARAIKGDLPDLKTQNTNQYFTNLNQGLSPTPGQQAAYKVGLVPGPETKFQEKLGEGQAAPIVKKISDLNQEAQSSAQNKIVGDRLLQEMAANPDLKSGPGVQTMTGVKNFINNIVPGAFTPQSEQELFQKGVGSEVLGGIGQLRANGVQRITQNEIQYVVPLFTPTMLNSKEGLKNIIELNGAIDPAIQRGQEALAALQQKARQDPNINLEQGINDIRSAVQQDAQTASMNFMNSKLAAEGKKIDINPAYNPSTNPRDKYIQTDMSPDEKLNYISKDEPATPNQVADNTTLATQNPQVGQNPTSSQGIDSKGLQNTPIPDNSMQIATPMSEGNSQTIGSNTSQPQSSQMTQNPYSQQTQSSNMDASASQVSPAQDNQTPVSNTGNTQSAVPQMTPVMNPLQLAPDQNKGSYQQINGIDPQLMAQYLKQQQDQAQSQDPNQSQLPPQYSMSF